MCIRDITGHQLPILGKCIIPVRVHNSEVIQLTLQVTNSGPSILGLKALKALNIYLTFDTSNIYDSESRVEKLKCFNATGDIYITPPVQDSCNSESLSIQPLSVHRSALIHSTHGFLCSNDKNVIPFKQIDQIRYEDSDDISEQEITNQVRYFKRLKDKPGTDNKHPKFHSSCGGCDNYK